MYTHSDIICFRLVTKTITTVVKTSEKEETQNALQMLLNKERENGANVKPVSASNTNGIKEKTPPIIEEFAVTEKQNDPQNNKENTDANNKELNREIKEINVKETAVENINNMEENAMTKSRITTEEEAKAALAERRRLVREEAERQAELERQMQEEEARIEYERQQREEEMQRILIEQQRAAERERLQEVNNSFLEFKMI